MFSRLPYYARIIAECATVLDAIIFVCVMKPSAFHSLCTIPLISATVDIRNTILRDCGRGSLERWGDDGEGGGTQRWIRRRRKEKNDWRRERRGERRKKRAWLGVIANADGYEAKADGVSDWLLSPALRDRYKASTELSPHFRWQRMIETCQLAGVNINVIQAVSSHLDPSVCASPFILDNAITPVNKYCPALVIMRRDRWDISSAVGVFFFFFFPCPPRCFSAISSQQRGEFSPAPSFRTGGISADPSGNKSGLWLRLSSSVKYQEPNDIWQYAGCKLARMC